MKFATTRHWLGFDLHPRTPSFIQLRVMRGLFIPMRSRKEGREIYISKGKPHPQPTQPPQKSIRLMSGSIFLGPSSKGKARVIRTSICLESGAIEHTQQNRLKLCGN